MRHGIYRYRGGLDGDDVLEQSGIESRHQLARVNGKSFESRVAARLSRFGADYSQSVNHLGSVFGGHRYSECIVADVQLLRTHAGDSRRSVIRLGTYVYHRSVGRERILQRTGRERRGQLAGIHGETFETCVGARSISGVADYHHLIILLGTVFRRNLDLVHD